jgi:DNA-directed RNA polymerase specialized sigma24 family protein
MALAHHHVPLLEAARRGEPNAIEQLLVVCKPDVRRYAQRHCLISDIDDAVQEALLVLARKVHLLQNVAAISAWLFKIVQRQGRLRLRSLRRGEGRCLSERSLGGADSRRSDAGLRFAAHALS